jgi:hypothetical protein
MKQEPKDQSVKPERLFRYFPPAASGIFHEKKLWFSAPLDFNDPFEALPRYDEFTKRFIKDYRQKEYVFLGVDIGQNYKKFCKYYKEIDKKALDACLQKGPREVQKRFGEEFKLVCFTTSEMNILMWSHYASSHTGFVLRFCVNDDPFWHSLVKVTYSSKRLHVGEGADQEQFMFATKSDEWKYENEYRMIQEVSKLDVGFYKNDPKKRHFLSLDIKYVNEVYFGVNMSRECQEEMERDLRFYPNIEIYKMELHSSEYALVPKRILRPKS